MDPIELNWGQQMFSHSPPDTVSWMFDQGLNYHPPQGQPEHQFSGKPAKPEGQRDNFPPVTDASTFLSQISDQTASCPKNPERDLSFMSYGEYLVLSHREKGILGYSTCSSNTLESAPLPTSLYGVTNLKKFYQDLLRQEVECLFLKMDAEDTKPAMPDPVEPPQSDPVSVFPGAPKRTTTDELIHEDEDLKSRTSTSETYSLHQMQTHHWISSFEDYPTKLDSKSSVRLRYSSENNFIMNQFRQANSTLSTLSQSQESYYEPCPGILPIPKLPSYEQCLGRQYYMEENGCLPHEFSPQSTGDYAEIFHTV
jgi:hypothetical protein